MTPIGRCGGLETMDQPRVSLREKGFKRMTEKDLSVETLIAQWRTERDQLNAAAARNEDLVTQAAWCGQALGKSDCADELAAHLNATKCVWTLEDPDGSAYQTTCGEMFEFNDGGPVENKAAFCQYCGRPLRVAVPTEVDDE